MKRVVTAEAGSYAGLGEFMEGLPEGLGTVVGEDGRQLSAGERHRVAMARTLLADPAVRVLDDATSAVEVAGG